MDALMEIVQGDLAHRLWTTLVIVAVGLVLTKALVKFIRNALEKSRLERAAHSLILSLTKVALYLLTFLSAASNLGVDVSGIVALASVLTLALSLALQDMISNVIGGFTVLYTHPFHSGDYVEIGTQGGTVREINMTYTVLTTPDNRLVSIPNKNVVAAEIVNYTSTGTRRMDIDISASYNSPLQEVLDALVQAGTVGNALLDPPPCAMVVSYGDSAIVYRLRLWTLTADYWDVYFQVNQRVKTIFDERGIEMTYPHLNVHLES